MIMLFFFQAEDGIRDGTVTGVQTCALPILLEWHACAQVNQVAIVLVNFDGMRSEERRVGKECIIRCWPNRYEKIVLLSLAGHDDDLCTAVLGHYFGQSGTHLLGCSRVLRQA